MALPDLLMFLTIGSRSVIIKGGLVSIVATSKPKCTKRNREKPTTLWSELPSKTEPCLRTLPLRGKSFNSTRMRNCPLCSSLSWARWLWQDYWFFIQSQQHLCPTQLKWRIRQRLFPPTSYLARRKTHAFSYRTSFSRPLSVIFIPVSDVDPTTCSEVYFLFIKMSHHLDNQQI